MFNIQSIFFLFSGIGIILLGFDIFLFVCFSKFNKKFNLLLKGKKVENLEDIILNYLQRTKKHDVDIAGLVDQVKDLQNISEKTFQKIATVRFNPFSDIGGNQSFAIALLDNKNNGFVISSLFIKDGNRVYAKAIKNGQSDYPLSKEEREAMERAMNY